MAVASPETFLRKLGARIRALRLQRELSQEALADRAELDRSYMSGIERGVRNPSITNIAKVARALSVPLSKLFAEFD